MIIDTHVHIFSYPSFRDLSKQIRTMEDAIAFRTRYPDLYKCNLVEPPIDSTDDLIADMDKNHVDFALVQARAGHVTNDMVAQAAKRHPTRMVALARVGHDQEAAGYLDDPAPAREKAPAELDRALGKLGMHGVGEIFVRSMTSRTNPEKIAADLGATVPIERAGSLERALEVAQAHARPGDVVLLAPACASFDQFDNYEHRGRVFKELVAKMENHPAATSAPKG